MPIGERLERGLEALKDIQWEIRENEARYRDLLDNQADVILRRDAGRLPHLRQSGLLPGVRARAQRRARPRRSRRACSPATRQPRWRPAAPCASSATCRRSRPRAARAGSSGRSTPCRPHEAADPRGAMPRPRHHRAAPRRGRADGGAQAGGGRQPRQVALPGGHEPRDPHADERHPRHDVAAGRHRALARAAHLRPRHRALGAHAADPDRRDPRLLQDRGRQAAAQLARRWRSTSACRAWSSCWRRRPTRRASTSPGRSTRPCRARCWATRCACARSSPTSSATPSSSPTAAACS